MLVHTDSLLLVSFIYHVCIQRKSFVVVLIFLLVVVLLFFFFMALIYFLSFMTSL